MPGTADPRRDEMRHVQWHELFADRNEPRDRIAKLLQEISGQGVVTKPRFPILHFCGVSGQGKSSLFYKTHTDAPRHFRNIRFAAVDLADLGASRVANAAEVLWHITHALAEAGIMAPLTVCLRAHHWGKQHPGREFRLQHSPLRDYLERAIRGCEILSPFDVLARKIWEDGQAAFKVVAIIEKCWAAASLRTRELQIKDLRNDEPGTWTPERIESSFSEFLALDILTYLKSHSDQNLCLMVDTFERVEPDVKSDAPERWFQDLCGRLVAPSDSELRGRTAILLFGRDELRWQRYDSPHTLDPWSNYVETCELTGFTKSDAESFLRNDYKKFWEARAPEVAARLQTHEVAILSASDEQGKGSTYLPYYLRLAGEMIYEQGHQFVPEMLGHSPEEMQQRFLKYLRERSPEKFRAIRTLALALYFDDDLFDHMVKRGYIHGIPIHDMVPALLANRSYVRRVESGVRVHYRFHRHLQQSLLDDLERNLEDIRSANNAIEAILEYYATRATFSTPADFRPEFHLQAYEHGMDVLLTYAERGWIDADRTARQIFSFEKPFSDDPHNSTGVRTQLLERGLAVLSKQWPLDRLPFKAFATSKLAVLYLSQGRYAEAEPLLRRALAIWAKANGPQDIWTAGRLHDLAECYRRLGRFEEAEPMFKFALATLEELSGPGHPTTAGVLAGLGELYEDQGRHSEAEPLLRRALAVSVSANGPHHLATARDLNNLAHHHFQRGCYAEAEPLYQHALAIFEGLRGPDHPETATILDNLGVLYTNQRRYLVAEPLLQRALTICEQSLGLDHPDTANRLNNLAVLYDGQGLYEKAEPLLQRALSIFERVLGSHHPRTNVIRETLCRLRSK